MRNSLAITGAAGRVQTPINVRQELKIRLGKLQNADRVSVAQLNKCLIAVTQCNASPSHTPLRFGAAQRMVNALAHVDSVLQNQRLGNRREATQTLAQIKQGVQALLQADLLCTTDQAEKQKALVAALSPQRSAGEEQALVAELDHLADECAWLHLATADHPQAITIRELDRQFDSLRKRLPEASRDAAQRHWQASHIEAFSREEAVARFPFDGSSTHLDLPPLEDQNGNALGAPRYIAICSFDASRWMMIGLHLKQREASRRQLDAELRGMFDAQAQKSAETRARDGALLPYMLTARELAKKQQLLIPPSPGNEQAGRMNVAALY